MASFGQDDEVINWKIDPSVQEQRDRTRLALLQNEQKQYTDPKSQTALAKEISYTDSKLPKFGQDDEIVQDSSFGKDDEVVGTSLGETLGQGTAAAADFLLPIGAVAGGLGALGDLALGRGLDTAANTARTYTEQYAPSNIAKNLGVPEQYLHGKAYETANKPMEMLSKGADVAGEKVLNLTGSPGLATETNVGLQALAMALGAKGASAALGKATIRGPKPEIKPKVEPTISGPGEVPKNIFEKLDHVTKQADDFRTLQEQREVPPGEEGALYEQSATSPREANVPSAWASEYEALNPRMAAAGAKRGITRDQVQALQERPQEVPPVGPLKPEDYISPERQALEQQSADLIQKSDANVAQTMPLIKEILGGQDAAAEAMRRILGKNQSGALDLSAFLPKKNDTRSIDDARLMDRIMDVLRNSKTRDEFARKLPTLFPTRERGQAISRIDSLWVNKDQLVPAWETRPSTFSQLPKWMQKAAMRDMPLDKAISEIRGTDPFRAEVDDINSVFLRDTVSVEAARRLSKSRGQEIINLVADKVRTIQQRWDRIGHEDLQGQSTGRLFLKPWEGQTMLEGFHNLPKWSKTKVEAVWSKIERDPEKYIKPGATWADEATLRSLGLKDAEIAGYKAWTDTMDHAAKIINEARAKKGQDPIQIVPGFFPHYLKGPFRVHVAKDGGLVEVVPFKSRPAAEKFIEKLKKDGTFSIVKEDSTNNLVRGGSSVGHMADFASDMILAAEKYMNKGKLNPILKNRLYSMVDASRAAFLKSAIERSKNVDLHYVGKEGVRDTLYGGFIDAAEITNVKNAYLKQVYEYAKNVDIEMEVARPLDAIMDKEALPNAYTFSKQFLDNAMNKNLNKVKAFDEFLESMHINRAKEMVALGNKALFFTKLGLNFAFLGIQGLQLLSAAWNMHVLKFELGKYGDVGGSPVKATGLALAELLSGKLTKEGRIAKEYAIENHISDTAIWDSINENLHIKGPYKQLGQGVVDALAMRWAMRPIEKANRTFAFMSAFHFARDAGMDMQSALEFGNRAVTITMGDYSKTFRPTIMTNYGTVGRTFATFNTLALQYLGNLMSLLKMPTEVRNLKDAKNAALALLSFTAAIYVFAGAQGIPGAQEWDTLANNYNKIYDGLGMPGPMPTWKEFMMNHPKVFSEDTKFGWLSHETRQIPGLEHGLNLGQGMNQPSFTDRFSMPVLSWATSEAVPAAWYATKELYATAGGPGGKGANKKELQTIAKAAPPLFRGYLENKVGTEVKGGTIVLPPSGSTGSGGFFKREPSDTLARTLGYRSLNEQQQLDYRNIYRNMNSQRSTAIAALKADLVERISQLADTDKGDLLNHKRSFQIPKDLQEATKKWNKDPDELLNEAIKDYVDLYKDWRTNELLKHQRGKMADAWYLDKLNKMGKE